MTDRINLTQLRQDATGLADDYANSGYAPPLGIAIPTLLALIDTAEAATKLDSEIGNWPDLSDWPTAARLRETLARYDFGDPAP